MKKYYEYLSLQITCIEFQSRGCNNKYLVSHKQSVEDFKSKHYSLEAKGLLCEKENQVRASYQYNWNELPSKCCIRNDSSLPWWLKNTCWKSCKLEILHKPNAAEALKMSWIHKHLKTINGIFLFFSLDRQVTKHQILSNKCQPNFFVVIIIWKEKMKAWPLLFLIWNSNKKLHLTFGI